jgi:phosphatidylglycerol---prolipoprotein diacylglyceryl transferase
MHPILIQLGPLQIRYYGLMYAIAITCGLFLIRREVARKQLPLSEDAIMNFVMCAVFGGIIGARAYYVIFEWESYRNALSEIVKVWHGGLAIHGGILGGTLAGWFFIRRYHIPFLRMADVVAPSLILGQAFGRFGNFMNGDAHGVLTTLPWGIVFPPNSIAGQEFPGMPLHPVMLHELVLNALIFVILWRLRLRPWKDGFIFCWYCILYSVGRFAVSFFRADNLTVSGLSLPHIVSILMILLGGGLILGRRLWEQQPQA